MDDGIASVVWGRNRRVTAMGGLLAVAVAVALVALGLTWGAFELFAFEILVGLIVVAILGGGLAARHGASPFGVIWVVLVPVVTVELLVPAVGNPGLTPLRVLEFVGSALYVGLGVSVPAGLVAYSAGVRSTTGPWEDSVRAHLPTRPESVSFRTVAGWAAFVILVTIFLEVRIVNLGIVWSVILLGGLGMAGIAGVRNRNSTEAMAVGVIAGAAFGLVSSLGFGGSDLTLSSMLAMTAVGTLVAGLPLGGLGYLGGRAFAAAARCRQRTTVGRSAPP